MNFLDKVKKAGQAMVFGENGHAELSKDAFDNHLLGLFQKLVRGMKEEDIVEYVQKIQDEAIAKKDVELVKKMFLLAFSTRNCRGGKGEKKIFYLFLKALYETQPMLVLEVLDLVPQYGYWKDLFLFLVEMEPLKGTEAYINVRNRIFDICADQHKADLMVLNGGSEENSKKELSLYAKYVPSEKSSLDKKLRSVNEIAKRVYGDVEEKKMMFRTDVAAMRKQLRVTETFMCSKRYSEINFATVPSVCMKRNTLAFLNDTKGADITENGTRFPDDLDRVKARKRLIGCLTKDKIKGAQVFPHELVETALGHNNKTSATGLLVVDAQWKKMRENVVEQIEQRKAKLKELADQGQAAAAVDLGNCVCMADVSGSMSGTPMMVSIAMGILLSEISHPAYRDVVLTFSGQPKFHDLSKCGSFVEKAKNLMRAPWGCNTNFYKALREIGRVAALNKLAQEDLPSLLVVSDMQFDVANGEGGNWNTAYDNIEKYFRELGQTVHGKPYDPPTIIFWNVRAGSEGFPCRADQEGVVLMSGFSPSLMKFILSGEMQTEEIEVDEDTGVVKKVKRQVTPEEMLEKVLQDQTLNDVRVRLDELQEVITV